MPNLPDLPAPSDAPAHALAATLFADADVQAGGSDKPFPLAGDTAWYVEAGCVDLFAVSRGAAPGRRAHLGRVEAGQLLCGLEIPADSTLPLLLAVGTRSARLRRLPLAALRARASDDARQAALHALVEGWVELLCGAWRQDAVPAPCTDLQAGTELAAPAAMAARPRREVAWVRHAEGHSSLLGRRELRMNGAGWVPLSARAWLHVDAGSRLLVRDTAHLPSAGALWDGVARLQELVLGFAALRATHQASAAADRLRRKEGGRRAALRDACAALASPLAARGAAEAAAPAPESRDGAPMSRDAAILAAAMRVGRALGVTMHAPPDAAGAATARDPVAAIARASRLRSRSVALRDDWWRHDHGPLLGFIGEQQHPVALLRRRERYRLYDPSSGTETPVTPELAATLQPFAHTFYRPFPDHALTMRDVVRTGLRDCGRDGATVFVAGLIAALIGMVPAVCTGAIFNTILPGADRSQLIQVTVILVACGLAVGLFTYVRGIALLRIESRMSVAVQSAVWDRLLALPMPFFRPYASGDLAMRAMGIDNIRQVISGTVISAVLGGIFSLCNFGLMFVYSTTMAWYATLLIVVAVLVTALGSWLQMRHQRGIALVQNRTSGLVLQLLSAIGKLRAAGAEITAFTLWAERFAQQRQLQYRARAIGNAVGSFHAAFPTLAMMLLFWSALPLIHGPAASMRTGDLLAFLSAYGACQGALLSTCMSLLGALSVVPTYEQSRVILQALPEVDTSRTDPGVLTGDIEVQGASFRYGSDGPPVLRGVSLHVRPGEFVAFVGPSGSGKSTILRLLLGFETPERGAIYYDGQELAGLDIQAVRRQVGVVLQSGRLVSGDIFSNIVGSAPLTVDDAWTAARMAGFAEDVEAMPMGMHTVVSEGGGTLSGGQRQRLMIARALVHRPRLLFFDEATSALDNRTQAIVSASLGQLHATRIVVAHRLSTIVNADRICVVERGQIVQSGRYDELMAQPGLFAELARRQIA